MLQDLLRPKGIVLRTEKSMAKLEGVEFTEEHLGANCRKGRSHQANTACAFGLDLREGQKTGFYLDQRENRRAAAAYMRAAACSTCSATRGGFAPGRRRARRGEGSARHRRQQKSHRPGRRQRRAEQPDELPVRSRRRLRDARPPASGTARRFDAVVLDPPNSPATGAAVERRSHGLPPAEPPAVDLLEPGGILVTCSCSGSVRREDFPLCSPASPRSPAATSSPGQRGAAPDHPVSRHLPGDRIPEVLHLPGGVTQPVAAKGFAEGV